MKLGVLGAGSIAAFVSNTLRQMEQIECYAVGSKSQERADRFAKENGYAKAYGSYEALVSDPEVELIYVATPHANHFENMMLCIEHGKPVICEKSFTINAEEAEQVRIAAAEKGVYVTEAIWPRYMPSRSMINDLLESGIIGEIRTMTANLSYPSYPRPRMIYPMLAGGALLDVGVYGINFTLMHFEKEIEKIESSVQMTETGVDGMESITLTYRDGRMAVLTHGIYGRSDRKGIFYGTKGYLVVENINNPLEANVFDTNDQLIKHIDFPQGGYAYEFAECAERISAGETESRSMPLVESVFMMSVMDRIRKQWGLVYPKERSQVDAGPEKQDGRE